MCILAGGLVTAGRRTGQERAAVQTASLQPWHQDPGDPLFGTPLRLIPASSGACLPGDLSSGELPPGLGDDHRVASIVVASRRTCRIGGPRTVTFLGGDGHLASPAVNVDGAETEPVVVGPGRTAVLDVDFVFDPPCVPPRPDGPPSTRDVRLDLAGVATTARLSRPVGSCAMKASLRSTDVYGFSTVVPALSLDDGAAVAAGTTIRASFTLTYTGTTTAVFDPCPTIWATVEPQSAPPVTASWFLDCRTLRPLATGDAVRVTFTIQAPAGLAPQTVLLDVGFGSPPISAEAATERAVRSERVEVTGGDAPPLQPVPFADLAAPRPPAQLARTSGPPCLSADLQPEGMSPQPRFGAGTHSVHFLLRNVSGRPCALSSDTPVRLGRNGTPAEIPLRGTSLFPALASGELEPDGTSFVGFQSPNSCDWPGSVPVAPSDSILLQLPDGTLTVPFALRESCGVSTTGVGVIAPAARTAGEPIVLVTAPATMPRGQPTTVEVKLVSSTGYDLGCPGYAVTVAGAETRHGMNCAVLRLLPGVPTRYLIEIVPPASAPTGPTVLRWELLDGHIPTGAVPVTLT